MSITSVSPSPAQLTRLANMMTLNHRLGLSWTETVGWARLQHLLSGPYQWETISLMYKYLTKTKFVCLNCWKLHKLTQGKNLSNWSAQFNYQNETKNLWKSRCPSGSCSTLTRLGDFFCWLSLPNFHSHWNCWILRRFFFTNSDENGWSGCISNW